MIHHNINFVVLSNNALAFIDYVTNYAIKSNCNQYQQIIRAVLVKKVNNDMRLLFANAIIHVAPDKFALIAFNRFAYEREISSPLIASYLHGLLDYYILSKNVKFINLFILWKRFPEFALHIYKPRSATNIFVRL